MRDLKPKSKIEFYLERMLQRGFTPAQVLQGTGLHADRLDDPHGLRGLCASRRRLGGQDERIR